MIDRFRRGPFCGTLKAPQTLDFTLKAGCKAALL